jgi:hypothetical protein
MPKIPECEFFLYKSGVYDLNAIHKTVTKWFKHHRFTPYEPVYKDKPGKFGGREINLEIYGTRKITGYIKYEIHVVFKGWDINDVEVTINGKKVKKQKGRLRLAINSILITDYEGRFEENRFLEKVRAFYEKYIIKKEIQTKYEAELWGITYDLHGKLKQLLELEA